MLNGGDHGTGYRAGGRLPTHPRSHGPGRGESRSCKGVLREGGAHRQGVPRGPDSPGTGGEDLLDGTPAIAPRHGQDLPPGPAAPPPVPIRQNRGRGVG